MTRVDFYIMSDTSKGNSLTLACRICEKALKERNRVFIQLASEAQSKDMDEALWTFDPRSFIPHQIVAAGMQPDTDTPVTLSYQDNAYNEHDVLINLQATVPAFFSQFNRVIEIIAADDDAKQHGRLRYRFYKDRGYPLTTHQL